MVTKQYFTAEDGHLLAASMLRELGGHWDDRQNGVPDDVLNDLWWKDESKIPRRYLATIKKQHSPALEQGFFAVLTDFICCCLRAGIPNIEVLYEGETTSHD